MKQLVEIEWKKEEDDWPWFWLLRETKNKVYLQGADYPDGSAKHVGDKFWADKSDIISMD